MTREKAKELFKNNKDAYGKPRHIMANIDKIYDEFDSILINIITKAYDDGYNDGHAEVYNDEFIGEDKSKLLSVDGKDVVIKRILNEFINCLK